MYHHIFYSTVSDVPKSKLSRFSFSRKQSSSLLQGLREGVVDRLTCIASQGMKCCLYKTFIKPFSFISTPTFPSVVLPAFWSSVTCFLLPPICRRLPFCSFHFALPYTNILVTFKKSRVLLVFWIKHLFTVLILF